MTGRGGGRARVRRCVLGVAALAACTACESSGTEAGLDLERMVVQSRLDAYEPSALFEDGKAMRLPPEGVVPYAGAPTDPVLRTGLVGGEWVDRAPTGYTTASLERGRARYGVYCAPCHGFDGRAHTTVAAAMRLRPPPPLLPDSIRDLPDGRVFSAITYGYGLMPSYAARVPVADRWAVVGYVRALRLAADLDLDELPAEERERLLAAIAGNDADEVQR